VSHRNNEESAVMDTASLEFERRVAALLADSADSLDGRTRSALTRARYAALEKAPQPSSRARSAISRGWLPAGAVATALLVVVFFVGQRPPHGSLSAPSAAGGVDDFALVIDADAFDLSNDGDMDLDSDFYEWAAATGGTSGTGLGDGNNS